MGVSSACSHNHVVVLDGHLVLGETSLVAVVTELANRYERAVGEVRENMGLSGCKR